METISFYQCKRAMLTLGIILSSLLCLSLQASSVPLRNPKELARGFGDDINWKTFHDGLESAMQEQKPILQLIHQEKCPACKDFAPRFANNKDIFTWSKYFTMMNCKDEEEPRDRSDPNKFAPDGFYYPRILFMSPDGKILKDVCNEFGDPKYLYYYYTPESVVHSMIKVLKRYYQVDYENYEDL